MSTAQVPLRTKLLYATGEVAGSAKNSSLNQFLLFFYADVVHLNPFLVGVAISIGKLWDAATDPVMGYLSDTTRSRWGRRRPYVIVSALPLGIAFFLLFTPPGSGGWDTFAYLVVMYAVLFTFFTVFATPYIAWGAELAEDYHERTTVVQIRSLFGIVGGVIGATAPVAIANTFADQRVGYAAMASVLGVLMTVTILIAGCGVTERRRGTDVTPSLAHFIKGLRSTFGNRDFRLVFVTFCLMTVAAALGQNVQLLVVKYWLGMYDFFPMIALVFALSYAASFPLWLRLSQAWGKRRAMLLGLALGVVTPFGWVVVQPGAYGAMLAFMVVAGIATGSMTLAMSTAVDVIDFDEWQTGERREGAYFGIWTLGLKSMSAVGTLISGGVLSLLGYVPDQVQHPTTMWWLIMIVGPMQAIVHLIGFVMFRRFRFEAADVVAVQHALRQRRAAALAAPRV